MISKTNQRYLSLKEKIQIDVFFSIRDVTALRWISEINRVLSPYQEYVVINTHQVNSDQARKMQIFTDAVVINNEKIEFYEVSKTLFELATKFIDGSQEYQEERIVGE